MKKIGHVVEASQSALCLKVGDDEAADKKLSSRDTKSLLVKYPTNSQWDRFSSENLIKNYSSEMMENEGTSQINNADKTTDQEKIATSTAPINRRISSVRFREQNRKKSSDHEFLTTSHGQTHKISLPTVIRLTVPENKKRFVDSDQRCNKMERQFAESPDVLRKTTISSSSSKVYPVAVLQKLSVPTMRVSRRGPEEDGTFPSNRNYRLNRQLSQRASHHDKHDLNPIYSLSTEFMRQAGYRTPPFSFMWPSTRKQGVSSRDLPIQMSKSTHEKLECVGKQISMENKEHELTSSKFRHDNNRNVNRAGSDSKLLIDAISADGPSDYDDKDIDILASDFEDLTNDTRKSSEAHQCEEEGQRAPEPTLQGSSFCNHRAVKRCLTFKKPSSCDFDNFRADDNNFGDLSDWDLYRIQQQRKRGSRQLARRSYGRLYAKDSVGQRVMLKRRKRLFEKRLFSCKLCLIFAALGLILTVAEAELTASGVIAKSGFTSLFLRSSIVLSTIVLVVVVMLYHWIEINISMVDINAKDWRVVVTVENIAVMSVEVIVCAICPIPANIWFNSIILADDHRQTRIARMPLDTLLSLPMFLRFYLIGRFMALNSAQFRDAATRSIARLNRVTVNFAFVMKSLMSKHPLRVLFGFTVIFWIAMSWILVQCERYGDIKTDNEYLNCLWFIVITFMSIGYGDIVPATYCGRVVAITTGIVGAGVSSALIAVMSMKLELSRAEKHVNNFMTDTKLNRQRKQAAALILQHTWFIHKKKNSEEASDEIRLRYHQRKFIAAITEFRRVKWEQRRLTEQGNALIDVAKLQNDMHTTMWEMQQAQITLAQQVNRLTHKVVNMCELLNAPRVENFGEENNFNREETLEPPLAFNRSLLRDKMAKDQENVHLLNAEA